MSYHRKYINTKFSEHNSTVGPNHLRKRLRMPLKFTVDRGKIWGKWRGYYLPLLLEDFYHCMNEYKVDYFLKVISGFLGKLTQITFCCLLTEFFQLFSHHCPYSRKNFEEYIRGTHINHGRRNHWGHRFRLGFRLASIRRSQGIQLQLDSKLPQR